MQVFMKCEVAQSILAGNGGECAELLMFRKALTALDIPSFLGFSCAATLRRCRNAFQCFVFI